MLASDFNVTHVIWSLYPSLANSLRCYCLLIRYLKYQISLFPQPWGPHIFKQGALIGLPTLLYYLCLPLPSLSSSSPSLHILPFPPFPPLSPPPLSPPPLYTNLMPLRHSDAQPSELWGFAKIRRLCLHFFLPTRYTTISILWPSFCDEQKTYLNLEYSLDCSLRSWTQAIFTSRHILCAPWPRFISQRGERHRVGHAHSCPPLWLHLYLSSSPNIRGQWWGKELTDYIHFRNLPSEPSAHEPKTKYTPP